MSHYHYVNPRFYIDYSSINLSLQGDKADD